jgi:hypothetical protein
LESESCKISEKYKNPANFRIASNLEPEMVQIYWKKTVMDIKEGFNPDDEKAVI